MNMNILPNRKRIQILSLLVEGSSMRTIARIVGVSTNTVTKLLVKAGHACEAYHDEHVRNVHASKVQCDEIWSLCYAKQKNLRAAKAAPEEAGDLWVWDDVLNLTDVRKPPLKKLGPYKKRSEPLCATSAS